MQDIRKTLDKYSKVVADELLIEILSAFGNRRVIFVGWHGSSLFKRVAVKRVDSPDLDIELILDKPTIQDAERLRNILNSQDKNVSIQLRYLDEIRGLESVINRSKYKLFMCFAYANARTLFGNNVYVDLIRKLKKRDVIESLFMYSHFCLKEARKLYINSKGNKITQRLIRRAFYDYCLAKGYVDFRILGTQNSYLDERVRLPEILIKNERKLSQAEKYFVNKLSNSRVTRNDLRGMMTVCTNLLSRHV